MTDSMDGSPIFNYVVAIDGREFIVTIFEDKMSQWDDLSLGSLSDRIHEQAASVVEVRISNEIYREARAMAEKEKAEEARTGQFQSPTGAVAGDIEKMDRMFTDFFWLHVNPLPPVRLDGPNTTHS